MSTIDWRTSDVTSISRSLLTDGATAALAAKMSEPSARKCRSGSRRSRLSRTVHAQPADESVVGLNPSVDMAAPPGLYYCGSDATVRPRPLHRSLIPARACRLYDRRAAFAEKVA